MSWWEVQSGIMSQPFRTLKSALKVVEQNSKSQRAHVPSDFDFFTSVTDDLKNMFVNQTIQSYPSKQQDRDLNPASSTPQRHPQPTYHA
jgi:hypothetical protein